MRRASDSFYKHFICWSLVKQDSTVMYTTKPAAVLVSVRFKCQRLDEKSVKDYDSIVGKGAETRDRLQPNVHCTTIRYVPPSILDSGRNAICFACLFPWRPLYAIHPPTVEQVHYVYIHIRINIYNMCACMQAYSNDNYTGCARKKNQFLNKKRNENMIYKI